jgi:alginate O-acetyltransferase complex protein AlgI
MVFSSISFIFIILPVFLVLICVAKITKSSNFRNISLLVVSLIFYFWGEAGNIIILIVLGLLNYKLGLLLEQLKRPKLYISIGIVLNILLLIYYKYSFWLLSFILPKYENKKLIIPLGISFFTFHAISYIIDVYRKTTKPSKKLSDFLTYFCMFPHLVAGPIVRYSNIKKDLNNSGPNLELFIFGMYRFLLGLNKKVIISNFASIIATNAFRMSSTGSLQFFDSWIGIIGYTIQIYFDFSGYSDMAIGLAAMAGFRFDENFNRPYSSLGMRDFWKRWHISLSSWLLDYLYIPLGGNKKTKLVTYINLILVFVICGIWHGANFTFLIWGLWHGSFIILERVIKDKLKIFPFIIIKIYTFLVIIIGWVFFRAENLNEALIYLKIMFSFSLGEVTFINLTLPFSILLVGCFLCLLPDKYIPAHKFSKSNQISSIGYLVQVILAILSISLLLSGLRNPFIYFNF